MGMRDDLFAVWTYGPTVSVLEPDSLKGSCRIAAESSVGCGGFRFVRILSGCGSVGWRVGRWPPSLP